MHYTAENGQRKLAAAQYLSRVRLCGQIMLAPLISDECRRQLQQYKQKAIEIERKVREQKRSAVGNRKGISAISSLTGDATVHVSKDRDSVNIDEDYPFSFSGEHMSSVGINSPSSSYAVEDNQYIPDEGAVVKNTGNDSSLTLDDCDFSSSSPQSETVLDTTFTYKSIGTDEPGETSSRLQQGSFTVEQNNCVEGQTNDHIILPRLERQRTFTLDTGVSSTNCKPKNDKDISQSQDKYGITESQSGLLPPIHVNRTESLHSSYENLSGAGDCEVSIIPAEPKEIHHHASCDERAVKVVMERLEEKHRREWYELEQRQKCEKYLVLQYLNKIKSTIQL